MQDNKSYEIEGKWEELISHTELNGCIVRVTVISSCDNQTKINDKKHLMRFWGICKDESETLDELEKDLEERRKLDIERMEEI